MSDSKTTFRAAVTVNGRRYDAGTWANEKEAREVENLIRKWAEHVGDDLELLEPELVQRAIDGATEHRKLHAQRARELAAAFEAFDAVSEGSDWDRLMEPVDEILHVLPSRGPGHDEFNALLLYNREDWKQIARYLPG